LAQPELSPVRLISSAVLLYLPGLWGIAWPCLLFVGATRGFRLSPGGDQKQKRDPELSVPGLA
jgi:hypothetical protein